MNKENTILKAIENNNTVMMKYTDKKGAHSEREVEPYEIKNGKFYGFCLIKNGIRAFDLAGINNIKITDKHFTPRW